MPSTWRRQIGRGTRWRNASLNEVERPTLSTVFRRRGLKDVTMRLRGDAEYVFVTDLKEGFYCSFDCSWTKFVKAMAM